MALLEVRAHCAMSFSPTDGEMPEAMSPWKVLGP